MNAQKTLIIVTPGFPKDESDSSCLPAFQQFVLSLKKCYPQFNFKVVSFQYPYFKGGYTWNGVEVIALGGKNKGGLYRLTNWAKAYWALKKLHHENNISGIISLWIGECSLITKWFCKRNKINQLMWLIGQDAQLTNTYVKRIQPQPQALVAMSDFLQQEFEKNHQVKPLTVIENGINEEAFPEFNVGERPIDIFGAGWLSALKNYRLFIEIVAEVKKEIPHIKAVIAGGGEQEAELKKLVIRLQLQNNVRFAGQLQHHKVLELMNQSKTFLHTSYYEGNSTVLMEALYTGCYTVSSQALSFKEVKNLHIATQKQEFVKALLKQLLNKEIRAERVVFNTMNHSAKRMMELLLPA